MPEFIGLSEIAALAGVSASAVANWRQRNPDFPKPIAQLKSGPVFRATEVTAWIRSRRSGDSKVNADVRRVGLRLLEFECGVATNVDDTHSAELVDYEVSRSVGQAARLAMLIRGQDVIEDEHLLKKVAALELGISPPEYGAAKRFLMEADLVEERTTRLGKQVLHEKVTRLDHGSNYQRIGELWVQEKRATPKERAFIYTLDTLVERPAALNEIDALDNLGTEDRKGLLELGSNAALIDVFNSGEQRLYYSPLLWDVGPAKLAEFLKRVTVDEFSALLSKLAGKAGVDFTDNADTIVLQAISGGILPSYKVKSSGGARVYSFAPYTGALLSSDEEKVVLDKARNIVACLRYGAEAATVTRIRNPLWVLGALTDRHRNYRLKPHSELKAQYGMLVTKQVGRVLRVDRSDRYVFELIPTEDNLRACAIAGELLSGGGEVMGQKDPGAKAALHLVAGRIEHPLHEVKVAKKKRPARADELAELVGTLRSVVA